MSDDFGEEEFIKRIEEKLEDENIDEDAAVYYGGAINILGCMAEDRTWECKDCKHLGTCMKVNAEFLAVALAFISDSICGEGMINKKVNKIKKLFPDFENNEEENENESKQSKKSKKEPNFYS